jgi:dynein assembly factor with WDR repeat domains 1
VVFNSQGTLLLTASQDKTAKIWDVETGECLQTLDNHTDEVFSGLFNYNGDLIITASKDNTINLWENPLLT